MTEDPMKQRIAIYGVEDLGRWDKPTGPKFAVGVLGVMPPDFIPMGPAGGFEINRNFRENEDAAAEKYMFREQHVDWQRAARNGEATVAIARSLVETPGLRWLHMRPWCLMAWCWPEMKPYFDEMLERMKAAVIEVCGNDLQLIDEAHRIQFPTAEEVKSAREAGILLQL